MERAIQPEIPSPSCGADERLRQHREASTRTRLKLHSAVQVAVPARATGRASRRDGVDTEFPRIQTSQRGQQAKAASGGQNGGGGFFQKCLAESRGSTPAERHVWREGVYDEIRDATARQSEYRANVPIGPGQPSGVLPLSSEPGSRGRGHATAIYHSGDCRETSATLRLSVGHSEITTTRDNGEPQTCVANDAGGQPVEDLQS